MKESLFILFLFVQNQPFYELYKDGIKELEAKNYVRAAALLEGAIAQKPESKKSAKTYGVQFIEYYPYHHLALAYYKLENFPKAKDALDKAYRFAENREYGIRTTLELLDEQLREVEEQSTPPPEPVLDTSRVTRYLGAGDYQRAKEELELLKTSHPSEPVLADLGILLENQKARNQELKDAKADKDRKIKDFLDLGRSAEEANNLEESLAYFQAVFSLDNQNAQANLAIPRLKNKLEAAGRSDQEVQDSITARLENNQNELSDAYSKIEKLTKDLELAQKSLKEIENRSAPVLTDLKVKFDVLPLDQFLFTAHINIHLLANNGLKEAQLFINDALINTWQIDDRKEFRIPFFDNYQFSQNRNTLLMKVTDQNGDVFQREHTHTFTIQALDGERIHNSQIILAIITFILVLFFIKKRKYRIAFRNRFNPYIAGAPILNENMFFGRRALLRQILNTIHNNSIMIYGERRIGKTSFLHKLNSVLPEIDDPDYDFIPCLTDLQGVVEEQFFSALDQEISHALEQKGIEREETPENLSARAFTQRLREAIHALKAVCEKAPKLVLLIDEVDIMNEFSEKTNQQLRSVFMKSFAKHLVAVMAGIHINTTWKSQGSPWYNFFEQIELKPFPSELASDLISNPVKGVYQFNRDAQDLIIKLSKGKPYLIQKLCVNLVAHVLNENRRKVTTKDVQYVYKEIKNEVWTGA